MPVKRVLGFAAVLLIKVCAGIMESSSGSASATPTPRSSVRRDRCFLVMNMIGSPYFLMTAPYGRGSVRLRALYLTGSASASGLCVFEVTSCF